MADIALSALLISSPVTEALDGSEPMEIVVGGTSRAINIRQLSSIPIHIKTSASNVLDLVDQGAVVEMNSASSQTLTIETNAVKAFPIGATILVRRTGDGSVTLAASGGVTIRKKVSAGFTISEKEAQVVLHKTDTNVWHVAGELTPA
jgi:hypothetical protein